MRTFLEILTAYMTCQRDEAMSKVKALREREAKETKQHGLEVQEFDRTLHHDKSILGFVKAKLKKRPAIEDAADRRCTVIL